MSISVLNTDAGTSGKTLVTAEGTATVTGLHTFDRDPSAPFAVSASSAVVTNLDADKLDGQEGSYYTTATNLASGTVPTARLGSGTADTTTWLRGDQTWSSAGLTRVLDSDTSVNTVSSSTTETTVYTYTVPANTLGTAKAIRLTLIGDYLNNSGGNSDLTVRVKYGSTTILSAAHTISASANRGAQGLVVHLSAAGGTSAQVAHGVWHSSEGSESNAGGTMTVNSGTNREFRGVNNGITENSTGALALVVTVQHSVNNANTIFRCHSVQTELLN